MTMNMIFECLYHQNAASVLYSFGKTIQVSQKIFNSILYFQHSTFGDTVFYPFNPNDILNLNLNPTVKNIESII